MDTTVQFITYGKTGAFPKIVTDYIGGSALLKPFYKHPVNLDGIKAAIKERKQYAVNRVLLVETLKKQYASVDTAAKVTANINQLGNQNTFTVTTAHQPNIFTGPLYFIYKILHAIKLAHYLNEQITDCHFVPVYYMGSEDADIEELGHLYINSEKYQWQTNQSGAVGRMKVDKALGKLIEQISGQMLVHPFGNEIISLLKNCYTEGANIEQATFKLVNELFKEYGLVVLLPDNAALKKSFIPVIEKELNEKFSYNALQKTLKDFPTEYKMQAGGREINLFWLQDGVRERIVEGNSKFKIQNLNKEFDKAAMASEVQQHPERFSPNVILRPVFQEMILPNIAFIGGGGELA
jgi:bacillithiol biosynthesis cysteine-adding enzyme BshC